MNDRGDDATRDDSVDPKRVLRGGEESDATLAYTPAADAPAKAKDDETLDATRDDDQVTTDPPTVPAPPRSPERTVVGRQFGDYELLEEIARGGMGVVYKARQRKLNRIVAVKMILAGQFASPEHVQRFYSEAEAAANLDHPGIVPIYEVHEQEGQHFFSMGYIDGESLAKRVRRGPLPTREAAKLTRQIAEAIQYAHNHGVVHRDLKPGNILITSDGQPRVTDFGLAKSVEGDSGLTATGQVLGTPSYMPPEQAAGRLEDVGPKSDIYSLGAILYCLLTGRPPFQASSPVETIRQVLDRDPPSPRLLNPAIDRDLETICLKCLEKNSRNRYDSAADFADELQRFLDGEPILARRIGPVARAYRWCRRKPTVAALLLAVPLIVLTAAAAVGFWHSGRQTRQLGRLDNQFQIGIERAELSEDYLRRMESLVGEIRLLAPTHADAQQDRLLDRFQEEVKAAMRGIKPTEEAIAGLEAVIASFERRDPVRADSLREELRQRMPQWRTVFELLPGVEPVSSVFESSEWLVDHDTAILWPPDKSPSVARTRHASHGDIELLARFGPAWQQQPELALVLNESPRAQYRFSLQPVAFRRGMFQDLAIQASSATFASIDLEEGEFQLAIFRNDAPLLRQNIPANSVPDGPLTLRARREQSRLTIQLNSDRPFSVRDPFPLSSQEPGAFALHGSPGLPIELLRATRRAIGQAANDLERGDELYSQGEYAGALAFYQREAAAATSNTVRRESMYKAGRCLVELDRREEAADLFQRLFTISEDDWAPLAGCQLWMLLLDGDRTEEADAVFELLQTHYRDGVLGAMVPQATRERILASYLRNMTQLSNMLRFDPQRLRNVERAAAVDRLLSNDGHGDVMLQLEVVRALRLAGDLESALPIAERLARETRQWNAVKHYSRLLRQTGNAEQAIREVTQAIDELRRDHNREAWVLRVERTRALAAQGRWSECTRELDQVLHEFAIAQRTYPPSLNDYLPAALMRGFLYERAGDLALAQQVWGDAFAAGESSLGRAEQVTAETSGLLIMGSLTDQLSDDHLDQLIGLTLGGEHNPMVMLIRGIVARETLHTVMREMWKDPFGRSAAEAIAFESTSFRDRVRMPLVVAGRHYIGMTIFPGGWTPSQDRLALAAIERVYSELIERGTITSTQAAQLALTWKGTAGILGWGGLKPTLEPDFRGPLAYLFAHRYLQRGDKAAAVGFFQQAIADAGNDDALVELSREDLEMLRAEQGMLAIRSAAPRAVELVVEKDGVAVTTVQVPAASEAEVRLPAGTYQLKLAGDAADMAVSPARVSISPAARRAVEVQ